MAWSDPTTNLTFAVGEVPPATKWNKIRDNFDYLYAGREGQMVYGTAGQVFTAATPSKVLHTTTAYDHGGVTYASGDATVANAGVYAVSAGIRCFGSGAWLVKILLNGTEGPLSEGSVTGATVGWTISVAAGAVFSCWAQTTVTATMSSTIGYNPFFVVQRVG